MAVVSLADFVTGRNHCQAPRETPKRGQGAECPDRLITKSGYFIVNFFGSNASALNTPLT